MIFDTISNIDTYKGIHSRVFKGLTILRDTDFSALEDKRYDVDGDDLFFTISTYETKPANDTPEAHIEYIDIQCLISGTEHMGVAALADMAEEILPRPEGDIRFYRGKTDKLTLSVGKFVVLFPGDAHAPGIAAGTPETVRKVVFKVRV